MDENSLQESGSGTSRFENFRSAGKLFVCVAAIILANAVVALYCLRETAPPRPPDRSIALDPLPSFHALSDLRFNLIAHQRAQLEYLLARAKSERQESEDNLRKASESIDTTRDRSIDWASQSQPPHALAGINEDIAQYFAVAHRVVELVQAPHHQGRGRRSRRRRQKSEKLALDVFYGPETAALNKTLSAIQAAFALNLQLAQASARLNPAPPATTRHSNKTPMAIATAVALSLSLIVSLLFTSPMRRLLAAARQISAGDLSGSSLVAFPEGEAAEVAQCLIELQTGLREMIQEGATCAQRIASASDSISQATRRQSRSAGTQQEHSQQIANTLQQMAPIVKEICDQSSAAVTSVQQVSTASEKSGAAVELMLSQIAAIASALRQTSTQLMELGKSSDRMAQAVSAIENVAAQSPDLMAKAAKEIALALKQVQAGIKIAAMTMSATTAESENGLELARKAAGSVRNLTAASQALSEIVTHISSSASQQVGAIEFIAPSLEQISTCSSELLEGAQQSAIATAEISVAAVELQNLANRFRLRAKQNRQVAPGPYTPEWARFTAPTGGREENPETSNLVSLGARNGINPGRARIHARLLTPETNPESPSHAPSAASSGTRG